LGAFDASSNRQCAAQRSLHVLVGFEVRVPQMETGVGRGREGSTDRDDGGRWAARHVVDDEEQEESELRLDVGLR
jgi:hypothetical protein